MDLQRLVHSKRCLHTVAAVAGWLPMADKIKSVAGNPKFEEKTKHYNTKYKRTK
jgi:hypothetical protein